MDNKIYQIKIKLQEIIYYYLKPLSSTSVISLEKLIIYYLN